MVGLWTVPNNGTEDRFGWKGKVLFLGKARQGSAEQGDDAALVKKDNEERTRKK